MAKESFNLPYSALIFLFYIFVYIYKNFNLNEMNKSLLLKIEGQETVEIIMSKILPGKIKIEKSKLWNKRIGRPKYSVTLVGDSRKSETLTCSASLNLDCSGEWNCKNLN